MGINLLLTDYHPANCENKKVCKSIYDPKYIEMDFIFPNIWKDLNGLPLEKLKEFFNKGELVDGFILYEQEYCGCGKCQNVTGLNGIAITLNPNFKFGILYQKSNVRKIKYFMGNEFSAFRNYVAYILDPIINREYNSRIYLDFINNEEVIISGELLTFIIEECKDAQTKKIPTDVNTYLNKTLDDLCEKLVNVNESSILIGC